MQMRSTLLTGALLLLLSGFGWTQGTPPEAEHPGLAGVAGVFQLGSASGEEKLRVYAGRSLLLTSEEPLERVSVSDPNIASAVVISPHQILIQGLVPGTATLLLWDEQERTTSYELQVEIDLRSLQEAMRQVFPGQNVRVSQSGGALVLTGTVSALDLTERVEALAHTVTPSVVNLLTVAEDTEAILLQVRFAEVNRAAIQELGANLFSLGAGNTVGSVTTTQFEQPQTNVGAVPPEVQRGSDPSLPNLIAGGIGAPLSGTPAVFGLTDLLNIFIFRADANLALTIRALEQRNLLQILAEPNILALNGREASFLAGGEFPFPVPQIGVVSAVTIHFKEFGVRLKFTPHLREDGSILLKVAPEVSALDFANALAISGFLIPALSTRRAETEVVLRDGQSFAIAGLIDNRLTEVASKVPGLGDIPLIGRFFRSRAVSQAATELLVLVTPKLVRPLDPDEVPPVPPFPKPFLDPEEFDTKNFQGRMGEVPSAEPARP